MSKEMIEELERKGVVLWQPMSDSDLIKRIKRLNRRALEDWIIAMTTGCVKGSWFVEPVIEDINRYVGNCESSQQCELRELKEVY